MSGEEIAILRAAEATDAYGDPVPGTYATHITITAKFAPSNPAEPVEVGRNAVISGGVVYYRGSSIPDIRSADRARIRAVDYEIDGDVGVWRRGDGYGVQFAVKRFRG